MLRRPAMVALMTMSCLSTAAYAAPAPLSVNLPAQDMATSLNALARQARIQISFPYDAVEGRKAPALKGRFAVDEAVRRLIAGSQLTIVSSTPEAINLAKHVAAENDQPEGEDLVVIGTRLTRERAIEQKEKAGVVQDVLGSDELGQLPEKNVGEALNHLPGVSMLVEKGEGRYVQIRGIDPALNNVTINGVSMGSPEAEDGGRASPLDLISGGILGGAQVIKTRTPDMDGQGIGGTVNIQTKMPFDRKDKLYGYAVGRVGYETARPYSKGYGGHSPYSIDGILSGKLADGRLGWLIGATYESREYATQGIYNDSWVKQNGIAVPEQVKNNYYVIGRQRLNLDGALQFRPDDTSEYFIRGFYAKWNEFQHRNRYQYGLTNDVVPIDATSGTAGLNAVAPNVRLAYEDKSMLSGAAGGSNIFGKLSVDYLLQADRNTFHPHANYWLFQSDNIFGPNHYSIDGKGAVTVTPDPSSPSDQDPSLMKFDQLQIQNQAVRETTYLGQFNVKYEASDDLVFKAGARMSRTKRTSDTSQIQYDPGARQMTLGTSPELSQGGFTNQVPAGPAGQVPNIWMDAGALDKFFNDPANAAYFSYNAAKTFNSDFGSDYGVKENVYSAYAMATAQIGKLQVIGGLRMEATHDDTSGYLLAGDSAQLVKVHGHYTDWLPSLIVNYRPTDTLVFRGAVTRALGRPGFDAIVPVSSYSDDNNLGSISIGNPQLRSRDAWNYDLSLEWYPNHSTALTVALFDKQIEHDLLPLQTRYTGQTNITAALAAHGLSGIVDPSNLTQLDLTTTVNGGTSSLRGIEVSGQTQFSMLPAPFDGLGMSAAATFIDGHSLLDGERIPLMQQPKHVFSFSGFYQKGPWDASVSYVLNASYLTGLDTADPDNNVFQGKFNRVDAKLSYAIRRQLKVFLEGVNLNNEPTTEFQGSVRQTTEYEYVGRTIYVGVSVGF